jgi:RNA polymerase sigma-70 factor (ECF subfamily)
MMTRRTPARSEFETVALPHIDALYGAAYRLTRNPRDAEDLVQDAMLRAYRFWDTFQKDSNCKAWLFRILTNTFINTYQKRKRTREVLNAAQAEQDATDGVLMHEGSMSQRNPEGILLDNTLSDDVAVALEALPADFRVAVVLCDVEGFSYKEIAEIMECPVGTVMSRLYRGRRLLKKSLHDFAIAQGIIRGELTADDTPEATADDKTIDLTAYRRNKSK